MKKIDEILDKILEFTRVYVIFLLTISGAILGLLLGLFELLNLPDKEASIPISSNGIIFLLLSAVLMHLTYEKTPEVFRKKEKGQSEDLNNRLATLTNALNDAGRIISSIELEMKSRQALVNKLETQKAIAEKAISLSKEQVEAVSALLSGEVAKQSKADARREFLKDLAFFFAGILVTLALAQLGVN